MNWVVLSHNFVGKSCCNDIGELLYLTRVDYGKRCCYIVLVMLFVEEIEFWVVHYSVESVEKELFHVEEEEKLPDHGPCVWTGLHSHQDI